MPRPHKALGALALFTLILATAARAQDAATVAGPVVNLSVLVTDEKGRYVDDVKPEELRVFEGGVEQKLAFARRDDAPLSYGLVVDNSGSTYKAIDTLVAVGQGFVA